MCILYGIVLSPDQPKKYMFVNYLIKEIVFFYRYFVSNVTKNYKNKFDNYALLETPPNVNANRE